MSSFGAGVGALAGAGLPPGAAAGATSGLAAPGAAGGYGGLAAFGGMLSIAGLLTGAVGAFYSAKSQQYTLQSQALSQEFEASMANLNARAAEQDAQHQLEAGQRDVGLLTLRYGQAKGAARTVQAAAGIQAGVGSAAEVQASTELAKQIDAFTTTANAVRAANESRRRATDLRNRSLLAGVSARNLRGTARSISPAIAGFTSLLGGTGQVAQNWAYYNRR